VQSKFGPTFLASLEGRCLGWGFVYFGIADSFQKGQDNIPISDREKNKVLNGIGGKFVKQTKEDSESIGKVPTLCWKLSSRILI